MAEDDVELDIGLKLDNQILASYNNLLGSISQKTQDAIQHTLDNLKGAVSKSWGEFPFASMHTSIGSKVAERMFLTSLAADLQKQGFDKSSNEFKAALLNAQYASSFPDPVQRYRRMQAQGYKKAAELTAPGTALGNLIQQDWEFLRSPWSRDYVTTEKRSGYKREDLEKLHVPQLKEIARDEGLRVKSRVRKDELIDALTVHTNTANTHVDFGGMRKMHNLLLEKQMEFAGKVSVEDLEAKVAAGEGRWKLPYGPHREDNFEPILKDLNSIDKELDKINDKTDKTGKSSNKWNERLKAVLGGLTAIGSVIGTVGATVGAAVGTGAVAYKLAERTTLATAAANDRRRGFLGMTSADDAATQVAGMSVSLGPRAIFDDIAKLSTQRENFLKFGKGLDPIYSSLQGTFNILTGTENPYLAYKEMVDKLYKGLRNASPEIRQQSLMLLDNQGLNTISHIVGAFLSNPELAKEYDYTPSKLFRVEPNKYREGAVSTAEIQTARIAGLNESLKKSYGQMSTDFEEAFGLPFKAWWEETMENKVVPTFQKIAAAVKPFTDHFFRSEEQKKADAEEAVTDWAALVLFQTFGEEHKKRLKLINDRQEWRAGFQYKAPKKGTFPVSGFTGTRWEAMLTPGRAGKGAQAFWDDFSLIAKDDTQLPEKAAGVRRRVQQMRETLIENGLFRFLDNTKADEADVPLMQAMQLGAYSDKGLEQFNNLVNAMINTAGANIDLSEVVTVLQNIEKNTGKTDQVLENEYLKAYILSYGGLPMYQRMEEALNTYKNQNIDRSH